jgi:hypothetical protein
VAKGTRAAIEGWRGEKLKTLETEGQMLQRVMPSLMPYLNTCFLQATDFAGKLAKFGATWHYASQNRIFALYIGFSTALATRFG